MALYLQNAASMAIFYGVVEDDPLDRGGRVIGGVSGCPVQGEDGRHRKMTFLGQQAWCDVCKSAGVIVAAPGSPTTRRMRDLTSLGTDRRQALDGDLVLCQCERHPRIVAVHGRRVKIIDDSGVSLAAGAVVTAANLAPTGRQQFDDRYILRDANGVPLRNVHYTLQRAQGSLESGTTDDQGHTHLPAAAASADEIHIYLGNAP